MTASAPRYDPRLLEAIAALDEPGMPIAETVRRVGLVAERLDLTRPSYVHVRRYVVEHRRREAAARARRHEIREILVEAYWDATLNRRFVDPYEIAARITEARAREQLLAPANPPRGSEPQTRSGVGVRSSQPP
jgi:hypothetical protein